MCVPKAGKPTSAKPRAPAPGPQVETQGVIAILFSKKYNRSEIVLILLKSKGQ